MYLTVTLVYLYFFLSPSLTVTVSMYVWLSKSHLKTGAINGSNTQCLLNSSKCACASCMPTCSQEKIISDWHTTFWGWGPYFKNSFMCVFFVLGRSKKNWVPLVQAGCGLDVLFKHCSHSSILPPTTCIDTVSHIVIVTFIYQYTTHAHFVFNWPVYHQ